MKLAHWWFCNHAGASEVIKCVPIKKEVVSKLSRYYINISKSVRYKYVKLVVMISYKLSYNRPHYF